MDREEEGQASGGIRSVAIKLTAARILFLAGALSCCAYAVALGLSQRGQLHASGAVGSIVAFVMFSLMHVAWWGALRKPHPRRIDLAKKASYVHIVMFISATLKNSPQSNYGIMEAALPIPDDKIVMAMPPLLVVISCINALLLRSVSVTRLE
ncbi:hypothetical protein [Actinomyces bowdenii]|uniref:Uncharacterized protein n=1 Tax=Actinomyces bowdenii TaxID=131109 RepID=A0A3P1V9D9_9ACTO|nr:hypothetical protein [Actinomyces bowdenii]RRD29995.1 hypothetical protein EII10_04725 [Actinomyces bowdenii]